HRLTVALTGHLTPYTTLVHGNHQIVFRRCQRVKTRQIPRKEFHLMTSRWIAPLLMALTLAAVVPPAHAKLAGPPIGIAVAGPLTGGAAALGTEQKQAVEMAVDERNAAGGILGASVVLVSADDKANAAEGQAAAQRFCDDARVLGVVGHVNSGVSIEAS